MTDLATSPLWIDSATEELVEVEGPTHVIDAIRKGVPIAGYALGVTTRRYSGQAALDRLDDAIAVDQARADQLRSELDALVSRFPQLKSR